jgi:hypothetical protein
MSGAISLSETAIFAALRGFLLENLPPATPVIRAYPNRVPEPKAPNFVLMSQATDRRISTNVDAPLDCAFIGTIVGNVLTVVTPIFGTVTIGAKVFGSTVISGTAITGPQYEFRWVLDAHLQLNPTVTLPQQFFDTVTLNMTPADLAEIFAFWGTNVDDEIVGTNIEDDAVSVGINSVPTGTVVV